MRALQYQSYGNPDVLEIGEAGEPHPGPEQVRIVVRAASVNPIDTKILSGMMAKNPLKGTGYPGTDAAGVVDEVGDAVSDVSVGDEVFGTGNHTHAEYAVLSAWASKPATVDWPTAAGAGVAGEASERVLRLLGVKDGTVFIDGGAGGVGAVATQMAVARGLGVIASAGPGNQDYLRELGAEPVVYGSGMAERVRDIAGGGVDGVFDVAGKTPIADLIGLAPRADQVVSIANFDAGESGARVTSGGDDAQPFDAFAEVAELLQQGKLVITTHHYPFDDAVDAYRRSLEGHVRGKLVLTF